MNTLSSSLLNAPPGRQAGARRNTPRSHWRHAIAGASLGLCIALLIWAPARWLAWGVALASQGHVQWLNPRGTLWAGSAHLVLSGGRGSLDQQALPGRLHWTLIPHWTGLSLRWRADCCMDAPAQLHFRPGWNTLQMRVDDHRSQWPAGLLSGLGAPWNTLQAEGQLAWRSESLQLHWAQGRLQMQGLAELTVRNLSSRLSPLQPVGSYLIQLSGTPEGTPTPQLQLSTQQGPLLLSGQGQWVGARLRFTGEARAQEGHEATLANLLNILGRRQGARSLLSLG